MGKSKGNRLVKNAKERKAFEPSPTPRDLHPPLSFPTATTNSMKHVPTSMPHTPMTTSAAHSFLLDITSTYLLDNATVCTYPPLDSAVDPYLFVVAHCRHLIQGYLDFPTFHFYTMHTTTPSSWWSAVSVLILGITLVVMFSFLGMVASEFFCPNLHSISSSLHLSESVAGVTLLAFGNGSPDLMATFTAMQHHSGGLAIGELIGASAFITTLVLGGVALIAPFRLFKPALLYRDAIFFLGALAFLGFVTYDEIMTLNESVFLIAYYLVYVLVVFGTNSSTPLKRSLDSFASYCCIGSPTQYTDPNHQYTLLPELRIDTELDDDDDDVEQDHMSEVSQAASYARFNRKLSILDAVQYFEIVKRQPHLDSISLLPPTPINGSPFSISRSHSCTSPFYSKNAALLLPKRPSSISVAAHSSCDNVHDSSLEIPPFLHRPIARSPFHAIVYESSPLVVADTLFSHDPPPDHFNTLLMEHEGIEDDMETHLQLPTLACLLFPVISHLRTRKKNLAVFDCVNCMYILAFILVTPFYCLLRLTVPVVCTTAPSSFGTHVRHPVLCHVQNFLGGTLATFVILDGLRHPSLPVVMSIPAGISLLILSLVLEKWRPGTRHSVLWSWFGFVIGMLWIFLIANEVVTILKTLGAALGISDGMLGLTIFAMGNSVSDLIANLTMARLGFPVMAVSACFASPMLNLVLGVGVSCAYLTWQTPGQEIALDVGVSIKIVNFGLIGLVVLILVALAANKFYLGRSMGLALIASYVALVGVALIFGGS